MRITVTHGPHGPSLSGPNLKKIPLDDWRAEAARQFGPNPLEWKFVCPSCGHIGRFDGHLHVPMFSKGGPCNYTLGGLLVLAETVVIAEDGRELPVFEFAPLPEATEGGAA
jgi:hypothetical protein